MKLTDLNNETVYTYRLGRIGRHKNEWEGWREGKMIVERRDKDMPGHRNPNAGDITCIYSECGWSAQYSQMDYCPVNNNFCCEDYLMEIKGLTN